MLKLHALAFDRGASLPSGDNLTGDVYAGRYRNPCWVNAGDRYLRDSRCSQSSHAQIEPRPIRAGQKLRLTVMGVCSGKPLELAKSLLRSVVLDERRPGGDSRAPPGAGPNFRILL